MPAADEPIRLTASQKDAPSTRTIAAAAEWSISAVDCTAGPDDRPYEERHSRYSIAVVVSGTFQYKTSFGSALMYPGALLLGNSGACFECGHEHGVGDSCIAFHFTPSLFEEIAASNGGTSRFRFPVAALPAKATFSPAVASLGTLTDNCRELAGADIAIHFAECVIAAASRAAPSTARISARDERRISIALRQIELALDDPIDLDHLASITAMSKYHFLRTFRRLTGLTPYQHVLSSRLRKAAQALRQTNEPVATIAYSAGFSDLSTFNNRFRAVFRTTPSCFRGR